MRRQRPSWHRASIVAGVLLALGAGAAGQSDVPAASGAAAASWSAPPGHPGAIPIFRATSRTRTRRRRSSGPTSSGRASSSRTRSSPNATGGPRNSTPSGKIRCRIPSRRASIPAASGWSFAPRAAGRRWSSIHPTAECRRRRTPRSSARPRGNRREAGAARRLVRGQKPVRPVHLARPAGLDDAGDLRQLVSDRAGAGCGGHQLRDDSRDAADPRRRDTPRIGAASRLLHG